MSDPARHLAEVAEHLHRGPLAHERVLETLPVLGGLLPHGGLRRGTVVGVGGGAAVSMALALAAGPTQAGSWAAVVGVPSVGLAAAAELGVALERIFLVAAPPARQWAEVLAAAAEGADVVIAAAPSTVRAAEQRRVQSRLQTRGAVLILIGPSSAWSPELSFEAVPFAWEGIGEGHGRLLARRVRVVLDGRRAGRRVERDYWLPGPDGGIEEAVAPAIPLRTPVAG